MEEIPLLSTVVNQPFGLSFGSQQTYFQEIYKAYVFHFRFSLPSSYFSYPSNRDNAQFFIYLFFTMQYIFL